MIIGQAFLTLVVIIKIKYYMQIFKWEFGTVDVPYMLDGYYSAWTLLHLSWLPVHI